MRSLNSDLVGIFRKSEWASRMLALGFEGDLAVCADVDSTDVSPSWRAPGSPSTGWLPRKAEDVVNGHGAVEALEGDVPDRLRLQ